MPRKLVFKNPEMEIISSMKKKANELILELLFFN